EVGEEDRRGEGAPGAEVDRTRAKALPRHGGVAVAAAGQARLEIDADGSERQQGDRVGARETDLARIAVDRLVDRGGEDLNADRQAQQSRDLEGLDCAH